MDSQELDSVLETAIETNDFKAIPHLIKAGANPNATSSNRSYDLLSNAVINGHLKCAKELLENGANPNKFNTLSGDTATHTLAFYLYSAGKLMKDADKWVKLFLNHNADFNQKSHNQLKMTPMEKFYPDAQKVYDEVISNHVQKKSSKPKM